MPLVAVSMALRMPSSARVGISYLSRVVLSEPAREGKISRPGQASQRSARVVSASTTATPVGDAAMHPLVLPFCCAVPQHPPAVMSTICALRWPIRSTTCPTCSSGTSITASSIGSMRPPVWGSILVMTLGGPTCGRGWRGKGAAELRWRRSACLHPSALRARHPRQDQAGCPGPAMHDCRSWRCPYVIICLPAHLKLIPLAPHVLHENAKVQGAASTGAGSEPNWQVQGASLIGRCGSW